MDAEIKYIGTIRSELTDRRTCPKQGYEGAPPARIDILPAYREALQGVTIGSRLIILTWLHLADREVLKVHPRGDSRNPLTGVFATRSPARPNPIGLHPIEVVAMDDEGIEVSPLEALDGTPVVDIKIDIASGMKRK